MSVSQPAYIHFGEYTQHVPEGNLKPYAKRHKGLQPTVLQLSRIFLNGNNYVNWDRQFVSTP